VAYAAKYWSVFYGPFREAADSAPKFATASRTQMDPANADEALREVEQDIGEGADIVMVKPALRTDVLSRVKTTFRYPTAVAGERRIRDDQGRRATAGSTNARHARNDDIDSPGRRRHHHHYFAASRQAIR
jgi:hypothetical protein